MFAIFLSEEMDPFYQICSSFPTVIFTCLLFFMVLYWVLAVLGMVEIEVLDFMIEGDMGEGSDLDSLSVMAGLLLKLGLNGVPLTIVLSLIALIGWLFSFFVVYIVYPYVPGDILKLLVSIPVFVGVTYVAALVTARFIKPLRPIFKAANQEYVKEILGQAAIVRTGRVDASFGEAVFEDGGAGLIVKVRSFNEEVFKRGDKVILLEYVKEKNIYKVISEKELSGI
ncbi:MAG: hypothetical protein ACI93R_001299 [Flavobacteriales bacterium]|jgi:hypothetical protein